ncbi:MAG TPA: hypothetical protein VG271_04080, partial [Beijerinckiaceae bacterium]|nr:hypothetical protein [Beijerinckiaceae bacterium]
MTRHSPESVAKSAAWNAKSGAWTYRVQTPEDRSAKVDLYIDSKNQRELSNDELALIAAIANSMSC